MLFLIDLRICAKYLLYFICILISTCALLIYIKDYDHVVQERSDSLSNAKMYLYINVISCLLVHAYALFPKMAFLYLYALITFTLLVSRLTLASHFYFILNIPNLIALLLSLFYTYTTYYDIDTQKVFAFPPSSSNSTETNSKRSHKRRNSHKSKLSRKKHRRIVENEHNDNADEDS